ncbi:MAG: ribosomal protein S18-alanine N-acetyltransferase [Alphaproteobacteria bacterium]|nr:ribosomal protein S18-alanine N-acetyltransferase [Alphaproteobacteria bacterium]
MSPPRLTRDVVILVRLHAAAFDEPWTVDGLAALLAQPGTFAFLDGESLGFVLARVAGDESEILTLAVAPAARRRGIATRLLAAAAAEAQERGANTLFLEVSCKNDAAKSLYENMGFAEVGRRRGYYTDKSGGKEDALVYRAELPLPRMGNDSQLD